MALTVHPALITLSLPYDGHFLCEYLIGPRARQPKAYVESSFPSNLVLLGSPASARLRTSHEVLRIVLLLVRLVSSGHALKSHEPGTGSIPLPVVGDQEGTGPAELCSRPGQA